MNLWAMKENSTAVVLSLDNALLDCHALRLTELGLRVNERIKCLKHIPFRGPRIYLIGDSVFSLAEDVASCIQVHEIPAEEFRTLSVECNA